jgi:hypothetical protein
VREIKSKESNYYNTVKDAANGHDPETKNKIQGAIARLQNDAKEEATASAEVSKYVYSFLFTFSKCNIGILARKTLEKSLLQR